MSRNNRGTNSRISSLSADYAIHGNTNNNTKDAFSNRNKIRVRSIDEIGLPYFPPEVRQQHQLDQQRQHDQNFSSRYAWERNDTINTEEQRAPATFIHDAKATHRNLDRDLEDPHLKLKSEESIVEDFWTHSGLDAQSRSSSVQDAAQLRKKVLANKRVIGRPIPLSYGFKTHRKTNRLYNTQYKENHFGKSYGENSGKPSRQEPFRSEKKQDHQDSVFLEQAQDDESTTINNNHTASSVSQNHLGPIDSKNVLDNSTAPSKQEYIISINNDKDLIDLWESIVTNYNERRTNNTGTINGYNWTF
ncbi:hypothetical protein ACO0QE_000987 [Hanseniaspora vineae]